MKPYLVQWEEMEKLHAQSCNNLEDAWWLIDFLEEEGFAKEIILVERKIYAL